MSHMAPSSRKSIMLWSAKRGLFEPSVYESGGQYPREIAEVINALETTSVINVVRPEPHWRMLDVGAGGGRWSISLAGRVGSVTALEPSAIFDLLEARTAPLKNIVCYRKAFQEFESSTEFNLIIISGVLMYILEPAELEKFLEKAIGLTAEAGFLVLREPVARCGQCFTDTTYRSSSDKIELDNCKYWEIIRPEAGYESLCGRYGLKKICSFPSHAPFFYHANLPSASMTKLFRLCASKVICTRNLSLIDAYNRLFRGIYGRLRHLMNSRSMRIMIFTKMP